LKDSAQRYIALHGLDIKLTVVNNREYDTTNNLFSLWLAREEMTTDFLVINGDNVFERGALMAMIRNEKTSAAVAIHKNPNYDNEDMKVRMNGSQVTEISKSISNDLADGESIGLRLFRGKGVAAFRYALDMVMLEDVTRNAFFVKAIQHMIDAGHPVDAVDVTTFQYGELDFMEDLKYLETEMSGLMKQAILIHTNPAGLYAQTHRIFPAMRVKNAG
jgi:choline kinase